MFDKQLRVPKERALVPVARVLPPSLSPLTLSIGSLVLTLGAAAAAWAGLWGFAVVLWLSGRVLDGLDGTVARERGESSDAGGLTDIVLDTVGYAAVPLGIAANLDSRTTWIAVAILMAAFYVNAVSWAYSAALFEKRDAGANRHGEMTSTTMPTGLVEGTETIVFYTVILAFSQWATTVMVVMAAAVALGVLIRLVRVVGMLR